MRSNFYISSSVFPGFYIREVLERFKDNGIFNVELSAPHPYEPFEQIKSTLLEYKQQGFNFLIHNYFPPPKENFILNIATADEQILNYSFELVKNSIELSGEIGVSYYGIHMGYLSDGRSSSDGVFEFRKKEEGDCALSLMRAAKFIEKVTKVAEKNKVKILLENLFPNIPVNNSLGCEFNEIKNIMSFFDKKIGLLLDLGHLNISSKKLNFDKFDFLEKYISEFGNRLFEVHISENSGDYDSHLCLEKNSWQMKALKRIDNVALVDGVRRTLCLEARNVSSFEEIKNCMNFIANNLI